MRLLRYIWECQNELEKIIQRSSYQMFNTKTPLSEIIVEAAGDIEKVRADILDLLNRLDTATLEKEVGESDGKIHQRDD